MKSLMQIAIIPIAIIGLLLINVAETFLPYFVVILISWGFGAYFIWQLIRPYVRHKNLRLQYEQLRLNKLDLNYRKLKENAPQIKSFGKKYRKPPVKLEEYKNWVKEVITKECSSEEMIMQLKSVKTHGKKAKLFNFIESKLLYSQEEELKLHDRTDLAIIIRSAVYLKNKQTFPRRSKTLSLNELFELDIVDPDDVDPEYLVFLEEKLDSLNHHYTKIRD